MRVGIVVPIYNVAPYLEQCLDSICRQTFQDWQIVCINDGSTDGSCEIVRRYADGHPQIRLVEQDNAGYGAAVNRGMDLHDTEYFGIIEPDDFSVALCVGALVSGGKRSFVARYREICLL